MQAAQLAEDRVRVGDQAAGLVDVAGERAQQRQRASTTALATGLSRTEACSSVHSAIPSSTGIGPNDAAEASQPQISSRSRSSPARRAGPPPPATTPRLWAHWLWIHATNARMRQARQRPRSSVSSSKRGVRGGARPLEPRSRVGVEADELALEPGAGVRGGVRGPLDRLVEHALRVLDPARVEQRDAERREDLGAGRVARRGQRDRALEQRRAGRGSPRRSAPRAALASRCTASATSASSRGRPSSAR